MRWADIEVATTPQAQDAVSNIMMETGCGGVAIQGDAPLVVACYLPVDDQLEQRLLTIRSRIKELPDLGIDLGEGEITVKYAEDKDWTEAWKEFYHVTKPGRKIVIKPPWEEYAPQQGERVIEMEPGMAFGTGLHQTTRMCLIALEKYMKPRYRAVDFGTGSGILAIAEAMLGASLVIAFDVDETAVRIARENVVANQVDDRVEVHQASNLRFVGQGIDLMTANLVAQTIVDNAEIMAGVFRTGGVLIASGIIEERLLEVEQTLRNNGFDTVETMADGEWRTVVARRQG